MDKQLQTYYELLGIDEQSSYEDIVNICYLRLENIQHSSLPLDEKNEMLKTYQEAISAITKNRHKIILEDTQEEDLTGKGAPILWTCFGVDLTGKGVPILWTCLAVICFSIALFFVTNDYSFSLANVFHFSSAVEEYGYFLAMLGPRSRLGTPYFVFMIYAIVFGGSFIRRCFSGGRNFRQASRLCYPVEITEGANNAGKRFLKEWIPISLYYPIGYFSLGLVGFYPSFYSMINSTYCWIVIFSILSIGTWNHDTY